MRKTIILPVLFLLAVSCGTKTNKTDSEEWIQLFNGKDLSGWIIKIKGSPVDVANGRVSPEGVALRDNTFTMT